MIEIRPSEERGHNKLSWLDSHFTFSFDQYYDPDHMQFRSLRVINEDVVSPAVVSRRILTATWKSSPGFSMERSNIATTPAAAA
jgi:hypothetical protein